MAGSGREGWRMARRGQVSSGKGLAEFSNCLYFTGKNER